MVGVVGGPGNAYAIVHAHFEPDMPALPQGCTQGMRALLTGGNRGLGRAIAELTLAHGGAVEIVGRSGIPDVGHALAKDLGAVGRVSMSYADLSNISTIEEMLHGLHGENKTFTHVVLNAAVVDTVPNKDEHGVNRMSRVNFLSNIVLVRGLLQRGMLVKGDDGSLPRIVVISSGTYEHGDPEGFGATEDFNLLTAMDAYSQTKTELTVWSWQILQELRGVVDVVIHDPGPVDTLIGVDSVPTLLWPWYQAVKSLFLSAQDAALPTVHLMLNKFATGTIMRVRTVSECSPGVCEASSATLLLTRTEDLLRNYGIDLMGSFLPSSI